MSEDWLQRQLQLFQFSFDEADKDKSGSLSFPEVCDALRAEGFTGSNDEIQAIFSYLDWGQDKTINRDEYTEAIRSLPKMSVKEFTLRKAFKVLDKDNSGYLTFNEILAGAKKKIAGVDSDLVYEIMSAHAGDADGKLHYEEFLKKLQVDTAAAEMRAVFTSLDADKSGFLTRKEIYEALKSDSELKLSFTKVYELVSQLGKDDDEKLNYEEFLSAWQKQEQS